MFKILIKLLTTKASRCIKRRSIIIWAYVFIMMIVLGYVIYNSIDQTVIDTICKLKNSTIILVGLLFPLNDFIFKLFMKHDTTDMDDYLKSRPIKDRVWNMFLVVSNFFNGWNLMSFFISTAITYIILPLDKFVEISIFLYLVSVVDGITITCIRKSPGWKHIILIVLVWLMWFFGIFCIWSFMQITTGALFSFILSIYYLFYAGLSYLYLCSIKHYDEHTHDTSKIVIFHGEKLYSLEYLGVFRPKRIRTMLIPIFPILYFVYNNVIIGIDNNVILNIGLFLSISSTSMILGGNDFGIESNFFDGIITRPLDTKRLRTQKYYFYSLLSFVCFILILPCHWFSHQYSIQVLVATLIYIIGTTNLFVLPTCLISSRWNLFETSYFNSQGNRLELNIFSIMSIIPMLIYITISMLLPQNIIMIIISILGLGGIVIHRRLIAWLANKWNSRRYELLDRYRSF